MIMMSVFTPNLLSQSSDNNMMNLDEDYLQSLPESVREDVLNEMKNKQKDDEKNLLKRPSSKLLKNEVVREWEDFKNKKDLINKTERYGLRLFRQCNPLLCH